ncbi:54S ribosomal protein L12, mitochondrial [Elasticomyces elasticus]|nr:54S ribosomal protein L12, mitochondrial [Elasticomyces elasticus]KAK3662558.1 54S ribosomal protein L12, mitochondrial [Elasticomyces elasticus]KAK4927901.1 54S ribosomal protein L12, mitochondrial [Elasticomyces elasticus]KAK5756043.1 54S ribosomal protein L12, mitochondrial [Elasticomyces elasticus]
MSLTCQYAVRQCARTLRSSSTHTSRTAAAITCRRKRQETRRWQSTEAATNPKIATIVDQIGSLTLLETADLVSKLKTTLNIPDMPMGGFGGPAAPAAAAPAEEPEEAAPAKEEKTLFNLKLESFDAGSKPKVIKEVKAMLGLSLVDSKKFVESAPKVMKEGVPKEEAEKMIETMKALGAVVKME